MASSSRCDLHRFPSIYAGLNNGPWGSSEVLLRLLFHAFHRHTEVKFGMLCQGRHNFLLLQSDVACATCVQTLSDDLVFYYYQVWASKMDFFKHVKSDVVKPLAEFIVDKVRCVQLSHRSAPCSPGCSSSPLVLLNPTLARHAHSAEVITLLRTTYALNNGLSPRSSCIPAFAAMPSQLQPCRL